MSQEDWSGYRRLYDRTQPVNQVLLAGHITLRRMAGAEDKYAPVTPEQLETMCALLREEMEQAASLDVPLEIDMHTGENWYEAK